MALNPQLLGGVLNSASANTANHPEVSIATSSQATTTTTTTSSAVAALTVSTLGGTAVVSMAETLLNISNNAGNTPGPAKLNSNSVVPQLLNPLLGTGLLGKLNFFTNFYKRNVFLILFSPLKKNLHFVTLFLKMFLLCHSLLKEELNIITPTYNHSYTNMKMTFSFSPILEILNVILICLLS